MYDAKNKCRVFVFTEMNYNSAPYDAKIYGNELRYSASYDAKINVGCLPLRSEFLRSQLH